MNNYIHTYLNVVFFVVYSYTTSLKNNKKKSSRLILLVCIVFLPKQSVIFQQLAIIPIYPLIIKRAYTGNNSRKIPEKSSENKVVPVVNRKLPI